MKRPLRPVSGYVGHESYPSCEEAGLSRRAFLRTSTAAAAVTVAGAVALTGEAGATPASGSKEKRQRVTIHLNRYTQIGQSGLRAQKLEVFTGDKGLARFLRKSAELRRVKQALDKRLAKVKLATLFDGRKLYQLERSLGAIVAGQYQKRTGRGAGSPDVMLSVTRHYGRMRLGGAMIRPHFPRRPTP